ncbi:MAG: hypothetical protein ABIS84_01645, partial [Arachnia sp.]
AQNGGAWLAAALLSVLGAYCLVLGMIGLIATARGRGSRITTVGAVMVAIGAIAWVGHSVVLYASYAWYAGAGLAPAQVNALAQSTDSYPLVAILIVLFVAGLMLGSIVLLVGLRRARRVPIWSLVAVVVFVVCGTTDGLAVGVLGLTTSLATFVPAALSLAERRDGARSHRNAVQATA